MVLWLKKLELELKIDGRVCGLIILFSRDELIHLRWTGKYLPVEGGYFAELHLHLTDVDQELVDSIDVRDQDDLAFRTFGLYDDNYMMSCAVMAIPIIMEVVNVKTSACTSIRERRRSEELHLLSKT